MKKNMYLIAAIVVVVAVFAIVALTSKRKAADKVQAPAKIQQNAQAKPGPQQPRESNPQPAQIIPKKISVDTNFNGTPDRFEYYDPQGRPVKVEADTNDDGKIEETIIYEDGKPIKSARDLNGDGKPDAWVDF